MKIEFTRLSSKGQVVIPREIRESLHLEEGSLFAIVKQDGNIMLKKVEMPKVKSWEEATKPFKEAAKKSEFTKQDLNKVIEEVKTRKK